MKLVLAHERAYRIGKRALQEWEQGSRTRPRACLTVIAKEPAGVRRALADQ